MGQNSKEDRINEFIESIVRVARGDYSVQVELSGENDEIDSLAMGINMMADDIKQSQETLKASERNLWATLASIGDAVIATDREGNVSFLNRVAEELTGWTREEAISKGIKEVFHIVNEETGEEAADPVTRVLREGNVVGLANHTILVARDGRRIPIDDSGSPIRDEQQDITGVVLVFRDISQRRALQEKLARHEKLALLGQLAGGVGHELRNPLGAIKNAAYFLNLSLETPDPEVKETLDILQKEVANSERIIGGLLDFARGREPQRRRLDVNRLFREALARAGIPANIETENRLDPALPPIPADPDQLAQVFDNILLNAVQAMPDGGRLIIKSETLDPGWIALSIGDTGTGIPEENRKKIFEPLFTGKAKGIGLGMAIVKTFVEGHGGSIEVQSEEGKGSTFVVHLPVEGN